MQGGVSIASGSPLWAEGNLYSLILQHREGEVRMCPYILINLLFLTLSLIWYLNLIQSVYCMESNHLNSF